MDENIRISAVIPLLNEQGNLERLHSSLSEILTGLGLPFEIIFVDDGSSDDSFQILKQIATTDPHTKGISLSRNFGHQIALMAGLDRARGEVVITLDADLQHPPSLIPELYKQYLDGYDIVNTSRIDTRGAGVMKTFSSRLFYVLLRSLSEVNLPRGSADFRLMSRKTVEALKSMPERDRFTRGMVNWLGFKQTYISYEAPLRYSGKTKYTTRKMFKLALDAITSFSPKPLRISLYLGMTAVIPCLIYSVYAIYRHFTGETIEGWTSLLLVVLLLGGIQLISIGIIGEYLARVFTEIKSRPLYIIKEVI